MGDYDEIRVVQLGAGALGGFHLDAFLGNDEYQTGINNATVEGVYDIKFVDDDRRNEFEDRFGIDAYPTLEQVGAYDWADAGDVAADEQDVLAEMLDETDPDGANMVTPHTLHFDQAMYLMHNGLDVHVEKPMATNTADAVAMHEYAEDSDLVLQPGYQREFHDYYTDLADATADSPVERVEAYVAQTWLEDQQGTWRTNGALSGETGDIAWGMAGDTGSHLLQQLIKLGGTPYTVDAAFETVDGAGEKPVDMNGELDVVLERPDGEQVPADVTIRGDLDSGGIQERMALYDSDGDVTVYTRHDDAAILQNGSNVLRQDPQDADKYFVYNQQKLQEWVDSIQNDEPAAVPPEYGVWTTALHEGAYRSAQQDGPVDVQALVQSERSPVPADD